LDKIILKNGWKLYLIDSQEESKCKVIDIDIPCTVFDALVSRKVIEDPFYGDNEYKVSWVYESDWCYECRFDLDTNF